MARGLAFGLVIVGMASTLAFGLLLSLSVVLGSGVVTLGFG